MNVKLQQQAGMPGRRHIDSLGNWIFLLPFPLKPAEIKKLLYGGSIAARRKLLGNDKPDKKPVVLDLPNKRGSHATCACIKPYISSFELLTLARKLVAAHGDYKFRDIGVVVYGFDAKATGRIAEALVAAILAAATPLPQFKGKPQARQTLQKITLFGIKANHGFNRTFAEAEGNTLARSLSVLPSNLLTPADYLARVRLIARDNHWKLEFYGVSDLKKKKAGAFLAVAQGSPTKDAGIVRLRYTPAGRSARKEKLILAGKGICYDTGGTNLKPANSMFGMHEDMQGSAVALGTLLALTRLEVDFPVECWMALAMNHIGPKAYKQNDVITACDGTTIEVVHTDAEGRMVLCDTLALASRENPKLIIDYATLTGACVYALGNAYSGIFSNDDKLLPTLVQAGRDSGERVWPFPLDEDFDKMIESDIADIKQCSRESGQDQILAARFLQRFVKGNAKWIHIDLSSSRSKGGLAHIPTDTTGFGIRYTLNLLLDKKIF